MERTSECEIVYLDKFYKFAFIHILMKCTFFALVDRNTFQNKKFHFLAKICEIWSKRQNAKLFA